MEPSETRSCSDWCLRRWGVPDCGAAWRSWVTTPCARWTNARAFVFEGQEHNAMDTATQQFAGVVAAFLVGT